MTTFSKVMNMPALPARRIVTKIQNEKLLPTVKQLANDSMVESAFKVKENANEEGECGISIDGTWQKRGHASHNGVVTAISFDYCLTRVNNVKNGKPRLMTQNKMNGKLPTTAN